MSSWGMRLGRITAATVVCMAALGACGDGEVTLKTGADGGRDTAPADVTVSDSSTSTDTTPGDVAPDPDGVPVPATWSMAPVGQRTETDVCLAWRESAPTAATAFTPAAGCEPGELGLDARGDAMRRLNFYRWLSGAAFTTETTRYLPDMQQCAFYQGSNGLPISHAPDTTQPCFTQLAADAAAISNLAGGVDNVTAAIDLFLSDTAHRSLVLAPGLRETAVGFYEDVACQLVFGDNWSWTPDFHRTIALPAPGPNPQPPTSLFTLLPATGHRYTDNLGVNVTVDGAAVAATVQILDTSYGDKVLEIRLPTPPAIGASVSVSVTGIETDAGLATESFTSSFVSCP